MSRDARFDETTDQALRLQAETPEDLLVLSALVQDAVCQPSRIAWLRKRRRFSLLLNRFRWEDAPSAQKAGRVFERVQSLLTIESALRVRAIGVDPKAPELVLSLLALEFDPAGDGAGQIRILLAGGGAIAIDVECLDIALTDMTLPYAAKSSLAPDHGKD